MAGSTLNFNLAYFDLGDRLDTSFNIQKEVDRFVTIDKELWGLYSVFGDGIISGWGISKNAFSSVSGISVSIDPGMGIINKIAIQSDNSTALNFLPPNATFYILATVIGSSSLNRAVNFVVSPSDLGPSFIKIGQLTTNNNSVTNIDDSVQDLISFKEIIKDEINKHHHRGVPSKIDLPTETKGKLPGSNIEDLDVSKITSGRFGVDRVPALDHNDLDNIGQTTHAGIDTFIRSFSKSNKELLGEIASINLMREFIFLKTKYPQADENLINTLLFIPGVSPNEYLDFQNSTAQINTDSMCISGLPAKTGQNISIFWDTDAAFNLSYSMNDLSISNDNVILSRENSATQVIENFEEAISSGSNIAAFQRDYSIIEDGFKVDAESGELFTVQGFFSGKFSANRQYRALFTKEIIPAQDWSNFDKLDISVKSISSDHGPVYAYFVYTLNGQDLNSEQFLLLEKDEITNNTNTDRHNFKDLSFDISLIDRTSVKKFVIFTDDTINLFDFYVDNILLKKQNLFSPQGTIRLRYSGGSQVGFTSVIFNKDEPEGTSVAIRIRIANSPSLLSRSSYSFPLLSGQVFLYTGTDAEIEITLMTDNALVTPTLKSIELRILADSNNHGFVIEDDTDWARGSLDNIQINSDVSVFGNSSLSLGDPVGVGDVSFSNLNSVQELGTSNVARFGFSGALLPLAPYQVSIDGKNANPGFGYSCSAERRKDKSFIISDVLCDRILLMDKNGNLIRGFGSNGAASTTKFFPLTSLYNPETGILTIALTQGVDYKSVTLNKLSIFIGATELSLSSSDILQTTGFAKRTIEIKLSSGKIAALKNIGNSIVYVGFKDGAFPLTFDDDDSNPVLFGKIRCYIANFKYTDSIRRPIFANINQNGDWIVCNAIDPLSVNSFSSSSSSSSSSSVINVSSIVQFNPLTYEISFTYNEIAFSDLTLGSIFEIDDTNIVIAGLRKDQDSITGGIGVGPLGVSEYLKGYRGTVVVVDRETLNTQMKYISPDGLYASDVSRRSDGNFVVAETSLNIGSGRVIVLDSLGNIIWQLTSGLFGIINDARPRSVNENIVISV